MAVEIAAPDVVIAAVRELAAPGSVGILGWWLSGRFRRTETLAREAAEKVEEKTEEAIQRHEMVDQGRHEENIKNFGEIRIILARSGLNGGGNSHT